MEDVYVVDFSRTAIGKFGKSFKDTPAVKLGGALISEMVKRNNLPAGSVNELIMGNVIEAGNGQNPAGQVAHYAGLPDSTLKYTVNLVCASGMLATEHAFREISMGDMDLVFAGGIENMSASPLLLDSEVRWGVKQLLGRDLKFQDSMLRDGLFDAFSGTPMGKFAEATAVSRGITREEADKFSVESHRRALKGWESGETPLEVIPVNGLNMDEGIRKTSVEELAKLPSAFNRDGILTAGNSSQLSDGASALLLASGKAVKKYNLNPVAKFTGFSRASMATEDFVLAPVPSSKQLMKSLNLRIDDIDLVEHNEAFSTASLIVRHDLDVDPSRFNVNGGAVAIGHPLGNSGSRIMVTLLNIMRSRKLHRGMATLCHGGGGGHSVMLEML